MSVSNFLEKKVKKKVKNIKDKDCPVCDNHGLTILYKMNSNKILAYRCENCGSPIFVGERANKVVEKGDKQYFDDNKFKCLVGGVEKCLLHSCSYYGNICELT
ncbi:hypothetical protein LCGC14_1131010 [marine sediment metagenome]|uniref:Uncharacterized protein n=1 Tax=marine sediment metagenome TaxID=412755 RepID=A0A0F9Q6V3_9ZZZZ